jgi:hypothetical protein
VLALAARPWGESRRARVLGWGEGGSDSLGWAVEGGDGRRGGAACVAAAALAAEAAAAAAAGGRRGIASGRAPKEAGDGPGPASTPPAARGAAREIGSERQSAALASEASAAAGQASEAGSCGPGEPSARVGGCAEPATSPRTRSGSQLTATAGALLPSKRRIGGVRPALTAANSTAIVPRRFGSRTRIRAGPDAGPPT